MEMEAIYMKGDNGSDKLAIHRNLQDNGASDFMLDVVFQSH